MKPLDSHDGRRTFLKKAGLGACVLAFSPMARAIGEKSAVGIGQIKHGGQWDPRPEALRRLLWETGKRTSIEVARDARAVDPGAAELFFEPLLVMTGTGEFPPLTEAARKRIARHLRFGGMLYVDSANPDDAFAASARREIQALSPLLGTESRSLEKLPNTHVLFKSFFLLDGAVGANDRDKDVWGLHLDGRLAVAMTQTDVLGAFERDRFGTWRYNCEPGGESQREMAIRFGINLMMYATCLDYKSDQVHIEFIRRKRRR
jgi:hypothetical protein